MVVVDAAGCAAVGVAQSPEKGRCRRGVEAAAGAVTYHQQSVCDADVRLPADAKLGAGAGPGVNTAAKTSPESSGLDRVVVAYYSVNRDCMTDDEIDPRPTSIAHAFQILEVCLMAHHLHPWFESLWTSPLAARGDVLNPSTQVDCTSALVPAPFDAWDGPDLSMHEFRASSLFTRPPGRPKSRAIPPRERKNGKPR